jgi:hypothetical protein
MIYRIITLFVLFLGIYMCVVLKSISDNFRENIFTKYHYQNSSNNIKLFDLGFKYIPYFKNSIIDDILVICPLFLFILYTPNIKDYIFVLFTIYLLRQICTILTILPPIPQCHTSIKNRFKNNIVKTLERFSYNSCSETVFSGHTALLLVTILFLLPRLPNYAKVLAYIYTIVTSFIIISIRHHYSIDVFLSWIICVLFYIAYFGKDVIKTLLPF